jgi:hypothetical protein
LPRVGIITILVKIEGLRKQLRVYETNWGFTKQIEGLRKQLRVYENNWGFTKTIEGLRNKLRVYETIDRDAVTSPTPNFIWHRKSGYGDSNDVIVVATALLGHQILLFFIPNVRKQNKSSWKQYNFIVS